MYVEMKHIEKNYGSFHASRDVSFGIDKGKLVALLGPSGSGKTTILRMLAGLENPNSGDIFIDGRRVNDIPAAKRGIGFVFQNYALFRYMTVFDNVAFSAAEEGTVEAVVFRGSHLDVTVRIKGLAVHGEYSFDDPPLNVGETVQVLIYRLYVLDGDKTYLKENSAMISADVFYI